MKWYRKAAEQGNAFAQLNLGVMYHNAQGVARDYVQAHMWFNIGAANGNKKARKYRDDLDGRMTSADISKAEKLAREWMAKHPK